MCITPLTLKKTYRNEQDSRAGNGSGLAHKVPCGKCVQCLKRRQNSWAFRLQEQSKISTSACFLTLTYEETPKSFNGHSTLLKSDLQKFIKKLRKKTLNNIKYYACGEYGTKSKRPHYHAIMFNLPSRMYENNTILETWNKGHVVIAPCNTSTIMYVTKYLQKGSFQAEADHDDRIPEFSLMSKKLGANYLTPQMVKHHKEQLKNYVTLSGGIKTSMPRYYQDKIFNKSEKKILNEIATQQRETDFQKMFDDSFVNELEYKKDQIRIQEKITRLQRQKI